MVAGRTLHAAVALRNKSGFAFFAYLTISKLYEYIPSILLRFDLRIIIHDSWVMTQRLNDLANLGDMCTRYYCSRLACDTFT